MTIRQKKPTRPAPVKKNEVKNNDVKNDEVQNDEVQHDKFEREEVKREEVKQDEAPRDEVKHDAVKQDEAQPDEVKPDEVKQDKVQREPVKKSAASKSAVHTELKSQALNQTSPASVEINAVNAHNFENEVKRDAGVVVAGFLLEDYDEAKHIDLKYSMEFLKHFAQHIEGQKDFSIVMLNAKTLTGLETHPELEGIEEIESPVFFLYNKGKFIAQTSELHKISRCCKPGESNNDAASEIE